MSMNTISSVESAESYLNALDENLMRETFEYMPVPPPLSSNRSEG